MAALVATDCSVEHQSKRERSMKLAQQQQTNVGFTPTEEDVERFKRHQPINLENEKNKRRKRRLELQEKLNDEAVKRLAAAELLFTETPGCLEAEGNEKTYKFKQEQIVDQLDIESAAKTWDLELSFGPYYIDFTRNGRYLLAGGKKGSLSIIDCLTMQQVTETNVRETIRDVCFLQNETLWAAAQKKYVYIYDHNGVEVHCLREHMIAHALEFLPYHYLLVTISEFGELRYLDISTGLVPAAYKTKRGPCSVMCQNPSNAVIHLGHRNGAVSLWTPNVGKPIVEFLSHRGQVTAIECLGENYLATAGLDGTWKIWDMRKFETLRRFHYFGSAPSSISSSQSGFVGLGFGPHVQIWKDVHNNNNSNNPTCPYMSHDINGHTIQNLKFRPYEDFCVIGSSKGLQSIVVPGSCYANYDSYSADPYETKRQRQEREVHSLLEKLPATTITANPRRIGMLDEAPRTLQLEEEKEANEKVKLVELKANNERKKKKKTGAVAKLLAEHKKYGELKKKLLQKRNTEQILAQRNQKLPEENLEEEEKRDAEEVDDDSCEGVKKPKVMKDALDRFRRRERAVYTQ